MSDVKDPPVAATEPPKLTTEEEIAAMRQQELEALEKTKSLSQRQADSANASVGALLDLARSARKVRQSSSGMPAVRPPSELTQKFEALKVAK